MILRLYQSPSGLTAAVLEISENDTPPLQLPKTKSCFENGVQRMLKPLGVSRIQADVSGSNAFRASSSLAARRLLAKRQRITNCAKILLDISKESSDWFPPLKSALGGVTALIKHYEVFVEVVDVATTYTNARSNSKMSGRRLRILFRCWRNSSRTLRRQRLTQTEGRNIDAQNCPGTLPSCLPRVYISTATAARWRRSRSDRRCC